MAKVPNGIETLPKISPGCVGRMSVTDKTTDGRVTTYSEKKPELVGLTSQNLKESNMEKDGYTAGVYTVHYVAAFYKFIVYSAFGPFR